MAIMSAVFNTTHGVVSLSASDVPAGYHIYRLAPLNVNYEAKIPAFNYTVDAAEQRAVDYLAPLGVPVTYGLKRNASDVDSTAIATVTVTTPSDGAWLRHLFFPTFGMAIRVTSFDDTLPGRLTTYAISGQRNAFASWDMRGGRDVPLVIAVETRTERRRLERLLASGAPVSLAFCAGLGNDPGIFAVGDVAFQRYGKKDRWLVTLQLTEVDMPRILSYLDPGDLPVPKGTTYDDREAELVADLTYPDNNYNDAARKWGYYWKAQGI